MFTFEMKSHIEMKSRMENKKHIKRSMKGYIKSHIEGIKNKYGQTVVTGWAFMVRPSREVRETEAAVLCHGRPVEGLTVAWTERPDLISAFFASFGQHVPDGARFGFRICFPSESGKTYRLRFGTKEETGKPGAVLEYVVRDGQIRLSGPAGAVNRLKRGVKKMMGRQDGVGGTEKAPKTAGPVRTEPSDPLISIIVPVYRPDPVHYREMLESVLAQRYDRFQLCLADGSGLPQETDGLYERLTREICGDDSRVFYRELAENKGIAENTNQALAMAQGSWIAMVDHDDVLEPDALWEAVRALRKAPGAGFLYTDSDLTDHDFMQCYNPLRKPGWSPETMYSANYITHFSMIRKTIMEEAGGFDPEMDGAQDWDMFWKAAERAEQIIHIPRVLYHWRMALTSTARSIEAKPYAQDAQIRAINGHIRRMGLDGSAYFADKSRYLIRVTWNTPVEWQVVDENGLTEREPVSEPENSKNRPERKPAADGAALLETVSEQGAGETPFVYIVSAGGRRADLSDDVCRELAQWAVQPGIGLVFPKLTAADGTILSAGVMTETGESVVLYPGCPDHMADLHGNTDWYRNVQVQAPVLFAVAARTVRRFGSWNQEEETEWPERMAAYAVRLSRAGLRHLMNPFATVVCAEAGIPELALRTGQAYLREEQERNGNFQEETNTVLC